MNYRTFFLFILFWFGGVCSGLAFAPGDTTHSPAKPHNITGIFTESMAAPFNQWQRKPWTIDTTLNNFEDYITQYNLGNPGLPYVPLIFDNAPNPLGFYYGPDYVSNFFSSDSTIKFYHTRAPYLGFIYVTDPKIHQYFHMSYAQNVGKHLDFAVEVQRMRSDGVYINQGTNLNQINLSVNYQRKRYELFANAIYGAYKFNQNGGIAEDTTLNSPDFSNRQTVPVNLQSARTSIYDRSIHFKQYLFFGFGKSDSSLQKPSLYISHTFRIASHANVFNDPGPLNLSYYSNVFKDSLLTDDSLHYSEMDNDITIGAAKGWPSFLRWEAGMNYQWVHFFDGRTDSIFTNYIAHACVYDTGSFLYNVQGREIVAGNQQGDMQASVEAGMLIDSARSIRIKGEYAQETPPLVYELYYGNNLQWQNKFSKQQISSAALVYNDNKWRLSLVLRATQIQNLVYFTTDAMPEQFTQAIPILTAQLRKNFTVGKWHLDLNEIYQQVANDLPLRLPSFVSENTFFYENYVFHHNMLLRIGIDVFYNTAYYAYAYMPIVDQYYLQNEKKLGDYAYLDPFVSFRVKTFRFFLRLENAGSQLIGQDYYYALHYPTPDRVLRFGISWDFWN